MFRRCTPRFNFTYADNNMPRLLPRLRLYSCTEPWYMYMGMLALGFLAIVVAWTGCRRWCCKAHEGGTEFAWDDLLNPYYYQDLFTPSNAEKKKKRKRRRQAFGEALLDTSTPMKNYAGSGSFDERDDTRAGAAGAAAALPRAHGAFPG